MGKERRRETRRCCSGRALAELSPCIQMIWAMTGAGVRGRLLRVSAIRWAGAVPHRSRDH